MKLQEIYDLPEWEGIERSIIELRGSRKPSDRFIAAEKRLEQKIGRLIWRINKNKV